MSTTATFFYEAIEGNWRKNFHSNPPSEITNADIFSERSVSATCFFQQIDNIFRINS